MKIFLFAFVVSSSAFAAQFNCLRNTNLQKELQINIENQQVVLSFLKHPETTLPKTIEGSFDSENVPGFTRFTLLNEPFEVEFNSGLLLNIEDPKALTQASVMFDKKDFSVSYSYTCIREGNELRH